MRGAVHSAVLTAIHERATDRLVPAPVVLRYFDAQGRAQALRHALADAGVAFEDRQVTIAEWPAYKGDSAFAGPFGSLPTLAWGPVTVAETLPIATFLARRVGQCDGIDEALIAPREGICSCCYLDVTLRIGDLLWSDVLYPGSDLAKSSQRPLGRVLDKLSRVAQCLPVTGWFGGDRPVVADFFVAEAVETVRYVLGPARDGPLRARLPRLFDHAERVAARPAIVREREHRPPNLTVSPNERNAVERIYALDLSTLGL